MQASHAKVTAVERAVARCVELDKYGELVSQLLGWTDGLIRQLDAYGIVDTPWRARRPPVVASRTSLPVPKLRAARVAGRGYGLIARFDF